MTNWLDGTNYKGRQTPWKPTAIVKVLTIFVLLG